MLCQLAKWSRPIFYDTSCNALRAIVCAIAEDIDPPPRAVGWGLQGPCLSGAGLGWQTKWLQQQRGLARYNCADSLDRTNVGSFFGAVQVRAVMCGEGVCV